MIYRVYEYVNLFRKSETTPKLLIFANKYAGTLHELPLKINEDLKYRMKIRSLHSKQ